MAFDFWPPDSNKWICESYLKKVPEGIHKNEMNNVAVTSVDKLQFVETLCERWDVDVINNMTQKFSLFGFKHYPKPIKLVLEIWFILLAKWRLPTLCHSAFLQEYEVIKLFPLMLIC